MDLLVYDSDVFDSLSDFFVARDDLENMRTQIALLGQLICDHGLHDIVGVSLLHKHFEIHPTERIVRSFKDAKCAIMTPKIKDEAELFPYVWRFSAGNKGCGFYPLEFCEYFDYRKRRIARAHLIHLQQSTAFLSKFAEVLVNNNLDQIFGLSGLHARVQFDLQRGYTLLELTNERDRILTLEKKTQQDVQALEGTTQTLWCFTRSQEQVDTTSCASHCYGHCNGHLAVHYK